MEEGSRNDEPMFSAVSSSPRQLFLLLRCINFASKAQVQISQEGLRFTVEESRVMQGLAFLEKSLFTTFNYTLPTHPTNNDDDSTSAPDSDFPIFQISLPSLLETLQILGLSDSKDRWAAPSTTYSSGITHSLSRGGPAAAFDARVLDMPGVCRLSCFGPGSPLSIILEESGVTTTCELVTYEPEIQEDIPLQRDRLAQKIIMRASWLHDAITELSSTSPTRLTITASPSAPFFTLSSAGPLGSATVEFSKDPQLLETFQVPKRTVNTYKYSSIKAAGKAMALASKVSIRGDYQGVLSLQFMIEVEGGGVSFVDFRFVPFLEEEGDDDEEGEGVGGEVERGYGSDED
ncbi:MAG: ssDNA endodeoxyribonuclease [Pycnora praestabilis]|nr:MAG: ssDNA endodeoxyribonuclease [Pycnora praestabilis]